MKTTIKLVMLCSDCIDDLQTAKQYQYWKSVVRSPLSVSDPLDSDYEYMEKNGYITSTETNPHCIQVQACKPVIKMTLDGPVHFYCANHKKHAEYLDD